MSTKRLSTVATDVIATYGIVATNVINSYRFGGERLVGFFDERFAQAVNLGAPALSADLRSSLIGTQQRVSGVTVKGLLAGTDRAQGAVGTAVDLATKGVSLVASGARGLDQAAKLNALDTLERVVMPAAQIVVTLADRIEEGSSELVRRVSGKRVPAKAVATRKLKTTTRQAAATRQRVTRAVKQQVGTAVAETATEASNTVRRAARKAKTVTQRVDKAVADTAAKTSNTARRVARKAQAAATAA
jgi:hypothetical protein